MITREPTEKLSFNARAEYGWRDTAQTVGNISGVFGPVAARFGAGYFRYDGISNFDERLGADERDFYRNFGTNGKARLTLSDSISVDFRDRSSNGNNGMDGSLPQS